MIGRIGVPVFFVISGFVIPYSMWSNGYEFPQKWKNFLLRRITRIEPPYLLSIFVCLGVWYVIKMYVYHETSYIFDWKNVLMHLGYLNAIDGKGWILGVYWTLGVEFQYYLLISLVFPLIFKGELWKRMLIISILLIGSFMLGLKIHEGIIFKHIPLFMAGILAFKYYVKLIDLKWFTVGFVVCMALIYKEFGILYPISAAFTAALILFNVDIKFKAAYFIGKISYSLYLMHWTFGVDITMRILQTYFPNANEFYKIVITIIGIFISIGLSYVYYYIIEKPAIAWGKKLK